jgi:hypothetical protein
MGVSTKVMVHLQKMVNSQRCHWGLLVCVLITPFVFASDSYNSIEWNELQAKDWQPPIIQPDPSTEHSAHQVDQRSLVSSLNNQHIKIPGYLIPTRYEKNVVHEFILVPFLPEQVKAHMHHDANQMIYVFLKEGFPVQSRFAPIWVEGKLTLSTTQTDEGLTGYLLSHATVEHYEY